MRSTGIKAIETHYNGYRFRSRLEARWAVYFDALGIEYEYEPEGFVLPGGETYLPDFYLHLIDAYVEIKSKHSTEIDAAKDKLYELATLTKKFGLFCVGDPVDNEIYIIGTSYFGYGSCIAWEQAEFILGAEEMSDDLVSYHKVFDVGIVVGYRYDRKLKDITKPNSTGMITVRPFNKLYGFSRIPYAEQERARQARFEHGECG